MEIPVDTGSMWLHPLVRELPRGGHLYREQIRFLMRLERVIVFAKSSHCSIARAQELRCSPLPGVVPDHHQQLLFLVWFAHVLVYAEFYRAIAVLVRST